MINLIMYILIVIGLFLLINKKNSKLFNLIICTFIILSFTFATSSTDSYAYEKTFEYICKGYSFNYIYDLNFGIDYGFLLLMKFFSLFSKNYIIFRFFTSLISILLIMKSTTKLQSNNSKNLTLYFLFPMAFDSFQIEFFLAYSIVIYAITIIINNEKYSNLKFIVLLLISSLIHKATIIFYFLLFIKKYKKVNTNIFIKKIIIPLILLFIFLNIFLRINVVIILLKIFPFLKLYVGNYYIDKDLNILTIIMSCTLFISLFLFSYYNKNLNNKTKMVFFMNCISMFILPMIFVSLDFERLLRPQLIINYIFLMNKNINNTKTKLTKIIIIIMLIFRFFVHLNYYISNNNDILNYFIK